MSDIVIGDFEVIAEPAGTPPPEPRASQAPAGELRLSVADLALLQRRLQESALRAWAD